MDISWRLKFGFAVITLIAVSLYSLTLRKPTATTTLAENFYHEIHVKTLQQQDDAVTEDKTIPTTATRYRLNESDVLHTIKTSKSLHVERAEAILLTWFPHATHQQAYFITDHDDLPFFIKTDGQMVVTDCDTTHGRDGLNCKMAAEVETFLAHRTKWWCHWDDDNYVNVPQLLRLLSGYDWREEWYVGRASLTYPVPYTFKGKRAPAWFAHGGCGFCVSRPLVERMAPHVVDGELVRISRELGSNDDCTIGFVINYLLGVSLTQSMLFNSHYHHEEQNALPSDQLKNQISLSYSKKDKVFVKIREPVRSFSTSDDPTRFYSIHCLVYPQTSYCERLKDKTS